METDTPGTASTDKQASSNERPWTLPFLLVAAIAVTGVWLTIRRGPPENSAENRGGWTPAVSEAERTVSLSIEFGNGARRDFAALRWSPAMTVAGVMNAASEFRPGIAFTQQGEGDMALLTSLDGVANDAAIGRFWLYDVDGAAGKVSFAVQRVNAGQRVHWMYGNKPAD